MPEAQSSVLRRFLGVNRQVESVFLGPQFVKIAANWIPDTTYLLTKRPGTTFYNSGPLNTTRFTDLIRAESAGTTYLYAYRDPSSVSVDELRVFTNDTGVSATVTGGSFAASDAVGRFVRYGDYIYCGNGVDPLKRITVGGSATDLQSIDAFADGSAAPTITNDTGSSILTGTYSYAWCIYDHTNKRWVERGTTRTVTLRTSSDNHLSFPVPSGFASNSGVLSSQYKAHLFISPVNYPIEFAHDHTTEGITASATIIRQILADGPAIPWAGVDRTGNIFVVHRNRLWVSGDVANPSRVYATSVLLPGLEQAIFDQGDFFPANAVLNFPADVTAMGLASVSENDDPASPLAIFTTTRTFLFSGDILDDPGANLVEVSSRVGCVGADAITPTPYGLFFLGIESVYRIPPGGGIPEDVGWPIAPDIKAIPPARRSEAVVFFHKGFLKVCVTPSGGNRNTVEFWLDLRNGGVGSTPSWWGPHTGCGINAVTTSLTETSEFDRAWAALPENNGRIVLLHQFSSYQDNNATIQSLLLTGAIDHGSPFTSKIYTLVRVLGKADTTTTIACSLVTDGGQSWTMDTGLVFSGPSGALWGTAIWGTDLWGSSQFEEVQSLAPSGRPRGLFAEVLLTHSSAVRVDLRDFDLMYEPVPRAKRARGLTGTPPAGA